MAIELLPIRCRVCDAVFEPAEPGERHCQTHAAEIARAAQATAPEAPTGVSVEVRHG